MCCSVDGHFTLAHGNGTKCQLAELMISAKWLSFSASGGDIRTAYGYGKHLR